MSVALPGTAVDGVVQVIPVGSPTHPRVTFPLNPSLELRLNVKLAELPTPIVAELADAEAVIVPRVSVAGFDLVMFSLLPVTVKEYLPFATLLGVLTVSVEVEVAGCGLNEHVAPAGTSVPQLRVTGPLKPLAGVI